MKRTLTQAITEHVAMRRPAGVGSEPYEPTPGQTFDTGPLVDDANISDAGGYPDTSILVQPDPDQPARTGPRSIRPLRKFVSQRFQFEAAADGPALLVTPSGIDAKDIVSVTLTSNAANRIRFGNTDNGAASGAYLGNVNGPTTIAAGPVYVWPVSGGAITTVDVLVVYEDDPSSGAPSKPCGCK